MCRGQRGGLHRPSDKLSLHGKKADLELAKLCKPCHDSHWTGTSDSMIAGLVKQQEEICLCEESKLVIFLKAQTCIGVARKILHHEAVILAEASHYFNQAMEQHGRQGFSKTKYSLDFLLSRPKLITTFQFVHGYHKAGYHIITRSGGPPNLALFNALYIHEVTQESASGGTSTPQPPVNIERLEPVIAASFADLLAQTGKEVEEVW